MAEDTIFDLLAKTKCQLIFQTEEKLTNKKVMPKSLINAGGILKSAFARKEPLAPAVYNGYYNLSLTFDHCVTSDRGKVEELYEIDSLSNHGIKTSIRFRIGEDFFMTVPITGEKITVRSIRGQ